MIDLDTLRCSVQRNNNFHFSYTLHMKHKQVEWYIEKSLGDFEQLQEALIFHDFSDVPLLPDLQVGSTIEQLNDPVNAEVQLERFIQELLRRPDTRACEDVLMFCDLVRRLPQLPETVCAKLVAESDSSHLSVSDICYVKEDKLVIASYEEKTTLSKIGRMWSIIEEDNLGAIRVYKIENKVEDGMRQLYEKYFHSKVRGIQYIRETNTLLVAKGDGCIEIFKLNSDATDVDHAGKLALHAAPILSINAVGGVAFTSAYDDTIRAVDIGGRETISGGKLSKRLNGDKLLTSTAISPRTLMIATSGNVVYTYYMKKDVPIYVDACNVPQPMNIRKIHCTASNIFVAHGNCVSCFGYSRYSVEKLREKVSSNLEPSTTIEMKETTTRRKNAVEDKQKSHSDAGTVGFPMSIRSAQFSVNNTESSFSTYQVYDVALRSRSKQLLVAYDVGLKCPLNMTYRRWLPYGVS